MKPDTKKPDTTSMGPLRTLLSSTPWEVASLYTAEQIKRFRSNLLDTLVGKDGDYEIKITHSTYREAMLGLFDHAYVLRTMWDTLESMKVE